MDYDAPALTWMLLPPHTVTLTFDLQNLTCHQAYVNVMCVKVATVG